MICLAVCSPSHQQNYSHSTRITQSRLLFSEQDRLPGQFVFLLKFWGPKRVTIKGPRSPKYEVNIFALSLGIILKEEWKSYCLHRCRIVDDYVAELYLLCETQDWLPAKIMFLTSFVRKQNSICPSKHSRVLIAQCLLCGTHHFNSPESN